MKLEDILILWDKDCEDAEKDLAITSIETASVHNKYYKILIGERIQLKKLESERDVIKKERYILYTQGMSKEMSQRDKDLAPRGNILKTEAGIYMDADPVIIEHNLKISMQSEKCKYLEEILKIIMNRSFTIKNAIEYLKFKQGEL